MLGFGADETVVYINPSNERETLSSFVEQAVTQLDLTGETGDRWRLELCHSHACLGSQAGRIGDYKQLLAVANDKQAYGVKLYSAHRPAGVARAVKNSLGRLWSL